MKKYLIINKINLLYISKHNPLLSSFYHSIDTIDQLEGDTLVVRNSIKGQLDAIC
jgi:hypothetical protein